MAFSQGTHQLLFLRFDLRLSLLDDVVLLLAVPPGRLVFALHLMLQAGGRKEGALENYWEA